MVVVENDKIDYMYCKAIKKFIKKCQKKGITLNIGDIKIHQDVLKKLIPILIQKDSPYSDILKYIDFSELNFFEGYDLKERKIENINGKIDVQKAKKKDLSYTSLCGTDLTDNDFDKIKLYYTNLENTNATINPETIEGSFAGCNLGGCFITLNTDRHKKEWEKIDYDDNTKLEDAIFIGKGNQYDGQFLPLPFVKKFMRKK